jgi:prepilin-type processing-associated H-X9-DG protein
MSDVTTDANQSLSYAIPERRRRSGANFLVWTVGIIVIGGMLSAVLLPSLCKPRETANRAKCASNLHQIGLAILLYSQENGGHYPPSLAVLIRDEQLTPAVMICPSGNDEASSAADTAGIVAEVAAAEKNEADHKHCMSYVYAGRGLTSDTATAKTVLAYEPLGNHQDDGTNVLFGDGHVEWFNKQGWTKLAADAGLAGGAGVSSSAKTRP